MNEINKSNKINYLVRIINVFPEVAIFFAFNIFYIFFNVKILSLAHDSIAFVNQFFILASTKGVTLDWFYPHFLLSKAVYIAYLKLLFLFGLEKISINAYSSVLILNGIFTSISMTVFFRILRIRFQLKNSLAFLWTLLLSTTFISWSYLTTIEVYALSFMVGIISFYFLLDIKLLKKHPIKLGLLHALASLFHIRYVLLGIIPIWFLGVKYKHKMIFLTYFLTAALIFLGSYCGIIFFSLPHDKDLIANIITFIFIMMQLLQRPMLNDVIN